MKAWVVGIVCILAAVCGWLWARWDGNPETEPDTKAAVEQIKQGVEIIKTGETPAQKTFEAAPGQAGVILEGEKK